MSSFSQGFISLRKEKSFKKQDKDKQEKQEKKEENEGNNRVRIEKSIECVVATIV